jgi:hypothetical protein
MMLHADMQCALGALCHYLCTYVAWARVCVCVCVCASFKSCVGVQVCYKDSCAHVCVCVRVCALAFYPRCAGFL